MEVCRTLPRFKVLFKSKGKGFNLRKPHRQTETRHPGARQEEGTVQNTMGMWRLGGNNSICGGWSRSAFTEEMTFELNFVEFVLVGLKRRKGSPSPCHQCSQQPGR